MTTKPQAFFAPTLTAIFTACAALIGADASAFNQNLSGAGATMQQQNNQQQIQQQQLQMQQQLAQQRQQEQIRQQQQRAEQQRQAAVQAQQNATHQEQIRQQQLQLQNQLAQTRQQEATRQAQLAAQQKAEQIRQQQPQKVQPIYQIQPYPYTQAKNTPIPSQIGTKTEPSYPIQNDWRGAYYTAPKTVQNQITGAGSLSTNKPTTTTNQTNRVGPDKLVDGAVNVAVVGTTVAVDLLTRKPQAGAVAGSVVRNTLQQEVKTVVTQAEKTIAKDAVSSTNSLQTTIHGTERLAGINATRGGVLTENSAVNVIQNGTRLIQNDGAIVNIMKNSNGKFDAVIRNKNGELITTFNNLSEKSINKLGTNYGWK